MTIIPTLLFLLGTVAVACNGAVIKGRPCEHYTDEETKTEEQVMVSIPEAPMLPPFSSNTLEFVAPLEDEIKAEIPEATTSLPSVPLSYQPVSIVSGDYAWPTASLYPNYPVNVLTGQAALNYPNVQIVPITDITGTASETSLIKEENLVAIPEAPVLPPFEAGTVLNYSQTEQKLELPDRPEISIGAAPVLPSWPALSHFTTNFMPYQQVYGHSRDELLAYHQHPWGYYPIAPRPCEHSSGTSPAIVVPELNSETESKPISSTFLEAPMLPSFSFPELPTTNVVANDEAPAKEDAVFMIIPEAPILPPFVAPEMPKVEITSAPISEVEVPTISQNDEVAPCEKEVELFSIPEAPVLAPFVVPELHLSVPTTDYDEVPKITKPIYVSIPEAPVLPTFVAPELHVSAEAEVPAKEVNSGETVTESKPVFVIIPEGPVLPPFTAPPALPIAAPMYDETRPEPASPCKEPKEEKYESFVPIVIPTAPVLPPFIAPEIPIVEEKEPLLMSTEAPVAAEVLYEEPENEPQQFIPIPAAPVLPTFVVPEIPTRPMYDEPKAEDCDKDKEYKPVADSHPYYLPIPATYALSPQSGVALPESSESIAECIRRILANRVSPSFYASLVPAAQGLPRPPMVPLSSPFYKSAMYNDPPVY